MQGSLPPPPRGFQKHERLEARVRHDAHVKADAAVPPPERRQLNVRLHAGIGRGDVDVNLESIVGSVEFEGFGRGRKLSPHIVYGGQRGYFIAIIVYAPLRIQTIHMVLVGKHEVSRQHVGKPLHGSANKGEFLDSLRRVMPIRGQDGGRIKQRLPDIFSNASHLHLTAMPKDPPPFAAVRHGEGR